MVGVCSRVSEDVQRILNVKQILCFENKFSYMTSYVCEGVDEDLVTGLDLDTLPGFLG